MTATFDFDRLLADVLDERGPQTAPDPLVDRALASARSVPQRRSSINALDRAGWPPSRMSLANPTTARLVLIGVVVLLALALLATAVAVGSRLLRREQALTWAQAAPMREGRRVHLATILADGRVLVAGGESGGQSLSSAERFDPATGAWSLVAAMADRRSAATATLLQSGLVLVAGGGAGAEALASAELFDPARGTWSRTGSMSERRGQHVAVRLRDGRVLVAGGTQGDPPNRRAEIYDPAAGTWKLTRSMLFWRASPAATLLADGRVLVAGGFGAEPGQPNDSAEIYDPATDTWKGAGVMSAPRADGHTATLLPNGTVLIVGGPAGLSEVFAAAAASWTVIGQTSVGVGGHTATLLANGTVLVAGGVDANGPTGHPLNTSQIFDPVSGTWAAGPPLRTPRQEAIAARLPDGRVLVAGGTSATGEALQSTELLGPEPP
jgi:hypothetical protein